MDDARRASTSMHAQEPRAGARPDGKIAVSLWLARDTRALMARRTAGGRVNE